MRYCLKRLLLTLGAVLGVLAAFWSLQGASRAMLEEEPPMAAARQPLVKKETSKSTPKPTAAPKPAATPKPAAASQAANKTPVPVQRTETQPTYEASEPVIDISRANEGTIFVAYEAQGSNHKVLISNGGQNAAYNIKSDGSTNRISLSLGAGTYTISIMRNMGGSKYAVVKTETAAYDGGLPAQEGISQPPVNVDSRFLMASNEINWNTNQAAIRYAATLTQQQNTTKDKVSKVYSFIVANIRYNYDVVGKLPSGYLPDIDVTYSTRKGICYDFSALFGGMLRSQGIPTKLCKGSATAVNGYHAWNEVYIDGKWYVVDSSSDSIYYEYKAKVSMFKSSRDYSAKYET